MQVKFKFSGPKSVLWSLVCYPLAMVSCIIGAFLQLIHQPHRAVGFVVLGFYIVLAQLLWTGFAVREAPQKLRPGDIGFLVPCALGSLCMFALIFGSVSDVTSNQLLLGSIVSLVIADFVSKLCEAIATRSLRPFYDENY